MPAHHYNHIFIRTQFLGQVLAARLAPCSQQFALVCDLLVETGRGEVLQGCRRRGCLMQMNELGVTQPGLATYSQADVGQALPPTEPQVFCAPSNPGWGYCLKCPFVFSRLGLRQVLPDFSVSQGPHDMALGGPDSPSPFLSLTHALSPVRWKVAIWVPDRISALHFPPLLSPPLSPLPHPFFSGCRSIFLRKSLSPTSTLEYHQFKSPEGASRTDLSLC